MVTPPSLPRITKKGVTFKPIDAASYTKGAQPDRDFHPVPLTSGRQLAERKRAGAPPGSPPAFVRSDSALRSRSRPESTEQVVVEPGDGLHRDALRAGGGALTDVGATAEALPVLLGDHVDHPLVALRLALREQAEVSDLRGGEQHRGAVRTGRDAGAAADAGGRVEGRVRVLLRDRDRVRLGSGSRRDTDVATRLDDPVERAPVHGEVLDPRERAGPPGLDVDRVAVLERPHVELARGRLLGAVRLAVDHDAAHAADALAAVVVEGDGIVAVED